nr:melanocortin-2 receptor accessory protein [Zootoca vivipara]
MANKTNSSSFTYDFEYYMDYLDLLPVDAGKLKANRYSIVIALWIGLASFVAFLFLILFYISRSGSTPVKKVSNRSDKDEERRKKPHDAANKRHKNLNSRCASIL